MSTTQSESGRRNGAKTRRHGDGETRRQTEGGGWKASERRGRLQIAKCKMQNENWGRRAGCGRTARGASGVQKGRKTGDCKMQNAKCKLGAEHWRSQWHTATSVGVESEGCSNMRRLLQNETPLCNTSTRMLDQFPSLPPTRLRFGVTRRSKLGQRGWAKPILRSRLLTL